MNTTVLLLSLLGAAPGPTPSEALSTAFRKVNLIVSSISDDYGSATVTAPTSRQVQTGAANRPARSQQRTSQRKR